MLWILKVLPVYCIELHLWYRAIKDSLAGDFRFMLCCFPESSAEVKKKVWPPTASSSPQKNLKLKKLVSLAEFKGVQDKSTGSCWCFEHVVVALLDRAHLLVLLSISRASPPLGNAVNNSSLMKMWDCAKIWFCQNEADLLTLLMVLKVKVKKWQKKRITCASLRSTSLQSIWCYQSWSLSAEIFPVIRDQGDNKRKHIFNVYTSQGLLKTW